MEFISLVQSSPSVVAAVLFLSSHFLAASCNFIHQFVNYLFSIAQEFVPASVVLFLSLLKCSVFSSKLTTECFHPYNL